MLEVPRREEHPELAADGPFGTQRENIGGVRHLVEVRRAPRLS
jgi:hypothetical protein